MLAMTPSRIEFGAELGPDGALLDHVQLDRQPAGAQRDGELVGGLDGEAAGDRGGAAQDRLADLRRGDDDIVEDDRERLADILLGDPGEALAAGTVEADPDRGLALLVIVLDGVGDLLAGDDRAALDGDPRALAAFGEGQDLGADRGAAGLQLLGGDAFGDQLELEPGGAADQRLQRLGVLQPGHLHQDAAGALADDGRLERAERVDAAVDDLAGDRHRLIDGVVDAGLGLAHLDPLAGPPYLPFDLAAEPDRLHLRAGGLLRLGGPGRIAHREAQLAARGREPGDPDLRAAHLAADHVLHRLEPLAGDVVGLRLEQQLAAAGKVEAEIDLDRLHPSRELRIDVGGQEARHRHQHADQADQADAPDLPARKIQHVGVAISRSLPWRRAGGCRSASISPPAP